MSHATAASWMFVHHRGGGVLQVLAAIRGHLPLAVVIRVGNIGWFWGRIAIFLSHGEVELACIHKVGADRRLLATCMPRCIDEPRVDYEQARGIDLRLVALGLGLG